jgi:hypothetical protein
MPRATFATLFLREEVAAIVLGKKRDLKKLVVLSH